MDFPADDTRELIAEATFDERIKIMCRHLDRMIEVFGENRGCVMFRKVAPWYAKRFGPAKLFVRAVVKVSTKTEFDALLDKYLEWRERFVDDNGNCSRVTKRTRWWFRS